MISYKKIEEILFQEKIRFSNENGTLSISDEIKGNFFEKLTEKYTSEKSKIHLKNIDEIKVNCNNVFFINSFSYKKIKFDTDVLTFSITSKNKTLEILTHKWVEINDMSDKIQFIIKSNADEIYFNVNDIFIDGDYLELIKNIYNIKDNQMISFTTKQNNVIKNLKTDSFLTINIFHNLDIINCEFQKLEITEIHKKLNMKKTKIDTLVLGHQEDERKTIDFICEILTLNEIKNLFVKNNKGEMIEIDISSI